MEFIIIFLNILISYFIGFLVAKLGANDELLKHRQQAVNSYIKNARINMVIRSYRNQLLREETELRALPEEKQEENALKYIDVKAKLELIRKIEEDVAHEMQKI